jgi:hypothetical protein
MAGPGFPVPRGRREYVDGLSRASPCARLRTPPAAQRLAPYINFFGRNYQAAYPHTPHFTGMSRKITKSPPAIMVKGGRHFLRRLHQPAMENRAPRCSCTATPLTSAERQGVQHMPTRTYKSLLSAWGLLAALAAPAAAQTPQWLPYVPPPSARLPTWSQPSQSQPSQPGLPGLSIPQWIPPVPERAPLPTTIPQITCVTIGNTTTCN